MKKISKLIVLLFIGLVLNGCAFGNKHSYHDVIMDLKIKGTSKIAVATLDHRIYVTSGDKETDFTGFQRGGYGNKFDVTTASGKPLAEEMTTAIVQSLSKHNFEATPITVEHELSMDEAATKLKTSDTEHSLLLVLREWKSDTMQRTALIFDITMYVLNNFGEFIAEKSLNGRDNLGGSFLNPTGHAKEVVPIAFKEKIESLLNDEVILKSLKQP